jgi:glycosyltransferase involved in cell wall biosynthesis
MPGLSAIVLTFNEEMHLGRCLRSLKDTCESVFVIDSFSTDSTVAIAKSFGATVLSHEFQNQAQQLDWALSNIPLRSKWLLRLDADEYLSSELAKELPDVICNVSDDVAGLIIPLRYIFLGRPILHGGRYPLMLLRAWRTGFARTDGRLMDERIILLSGSTYELKSEIIHEDIRGLSFFVRKHDAYASREAIAILSEKTSKTRRVFDRNNKHSLARQHLKRVYSNAHPLFAPFLYFAYRFVLQRGFLDGWQGLIYHTLQGFWYRFLVGAKIFEIENAIRHSELLTDEMRDILIRNGLSAELSREE